MEGVTDQQTGEDSDKNHGYLISVWVGIVILFLSGFRLYHVQVTHERGQNMRDSNARQNAHDWGQYQHESNHHPLQ